MTYYDQLEKTLPAVEAQWTDPNPELSRQRLDGLREVAGDLRQSMPEYLGMTAFGSTVRGEARPDSDLDLCTFINAEEGNEHAIAAKRIDTGKTAGSYEPSGEGVVPRLRSIIMKTMENHSLPGWRSDIDIMVLSHAIVADETETLMENGAKTVKNDSFSIGEVTGNVRRLFYAPIDTEGLEPYMRQVLETLSNDERGERAWRLIRIVVAHFENGKGVETRPPQHRYFPVNLEEARGYYLHEQ